MLHLSGLSGPWLWTTIMSGEEKKGPPSMCPMDEREYGPDMRDEATTSEK